MKTFCLSIMVMAFLSLSASAFAQQKYAVLIIGDYVVSDRDIPDPDQWNGGEGYSNGIDEFWNDTT